MKPGFGEQTTLRFPKHGNKAFGAHASDLIVKFVSKESLLFFSSVKTTKSSESCSFFVTLREAHCSVLLPVKNEKIPMLFVK